MNSIIKQIAIENNTTEYAVKNEMKLAIREAMKSTQPKAKAFWSEISPDGKEPPIEKVIIAIAAKVNNGKIQ